jgi:hypothetical protein
MNIATQEKTTKLPSFCPNCKHLLGRPPSWLRILKAMSPGSGHRSVVYTRNAVKRAAKMSHQHGDPAFSEAIVQGLIEPAPGVVGELVYRKTTYGTLVLSRWEAAGWKPSKLGRKSK